jgi:hypothetical protein
MLISYASFYLFLTTCIHFLKALPTRLDLVNSIVNMLYILLQNVLNLGFCIPIKRLCLLLRVATFISCSFACKVLGH